MTWIPRLLLAGSLILVAALSRADASLVASVLPTSRSVQVNDSASVFATIVNAGTQAGVNCRIELDPELAGTGLELSYQTTDPGTNALVGVADTPVDLPIGGLQTFVIQVISTAEFTPANFAPQFLCDNAAAATEIVGINTFTFVASTQPVADMIALGATLSRDGVVVLPSATSSSVFSVATVNVGAQAVINASADFGGTDLPAVVAMCQTDPLTSLCINPITPTTDPVELTVAPSETPTFGVFVSSSGDIPFDPANNRTFVRFRNSSGDLRGSTSVALRLRGPDDALLLTRNNASDALTPGLELQANLYNLSASALRAIRLALGSGSFSEAGPCSRSGEYSIAGRDSNGDGRLRTGDGLTITYQNCSSALDADRTYTGSMSLELREAFVSDRGQARFVVEVAATDMRLESLDTGVARLSASYTFSYARSEALERFEILLSENNRLTLDNAGDSRRLSAFEWRRVLRPTITNEYELAFSGTVRSTALGGTQTCATTDLGGSPGFNTFVAPAFGEYRCRGADEVSVSLDNLGQVILESAAGQEPIEDVPSWRGRAPALLFGGQLGNADWPGFLRLQEPPLAAELSVAVTDMVGSNATGLVYVSNAAGVLALNPATGRLVDSYSMSGAAGSLAISDDGMVLYVGYAESPHMQTLDLASGEFGALQDLGAAPGPVQDPPLEFVAGKLAFLPGSRTDVVVSFRPQLNSTLHLGLALYSDGVRAPNVAVADAPAHHLVFHDNRLFGSGDNQLTEFDWDAQGVTPATTIADFTLGSSWPLQSIGGRLMSDLGRIIDFDAALLEGAFERTGSGFRRRALSMGVNNERAHLATEDELIVYDAQRLTPLATYASPLDRTERLMARTTVGNYMVLASATKLVVLDHRDLSDVPAPACQSIPLALLFEGTQAIQLQCAFNDFVLDTSRDRIYASVSHRNGTGGNSIAIIDVASGVIEQFVPVATEPNKLALSADSATLFFSYKQRNSVGRLNLGSLEIADGLSLTNELASGDRQFALPGNLVAAPTGVLDVVVSLDEERLVLLREAGLAENEITLNAPIEFVVADNGLLYGVNGGRLTEARLESSGFTVLRTTNNQIFSGGFVHSGGQLYSRSGYRFDIGSFTGARVFLVPGGAQSVAADPASDEVVFQQNNSGTLNLYLTDETAVSFETLNRPLVLGRVYGLNPSSVVAKISAELPDRFVLIGNAAMLLIPKSEVIR